MPYPEITGPLFPGKTGQKTTNGTGIGTMPHPEITGPLLPGKSGPKTTNGTGIGTLSQPLPWGSLPPLTMICLLAPLYFYVK
jgi:hypothetical protein